MNTIQQTSVIQINQKANLQNSNQDKQKVEDNQYNLHNQISQSLNEENDKLFNNSIAPSPSPLQKKQQKCQELDIQKIELKNSVDEQIEWEDNQAELSLLKIYLNLRKPGCKQKGYILYSETLIDRLIKERRLQDYFNKQFQVDRQPEWSFLNEEMETPIDFGDIRVLCVTWNMHGNMPQLCTQKLFRVEDIKHHVIIVSSQECQRSIPMSLFCESKQKWEAHICQVLGNEYTMIQSASMNALHMGVYIHKTIHQYCTAISIDYKATGIANLVGNKGGIGISMEIGEKSFLFINSHFASGQNSNTQRNEDYKKISSSLNLPKYYSNPNESLFKRFDYIFWMGDFNYRIEAQSKEEVDQLLKEKKYFDLLKRDQLMGQRKVGQVFTEFQEGLILFPPSYKMNDDENKYSQGDNARIPGWTDRIFFKQKHPDSILLLNYEMGLNVFGSDHRPIFAQFLTKVKISQNFKPISVKPSNSMCTLF